MFNNDKIAIASIYTIAYANKTTSMINGVVQNRKDNKIAANAISFDQLCDTFDTIYK